MTPKTHLTPQQRKDTHHWFRSRGVPLIISATDRAKDLFPRSTPVTAWLALTGLLYALAWQILISLTAEDYTNPGQALGISNDTFFLISFSLSFLIPIILLIIPWTLRRYLTRFKTRSLYPLGLTSFTLSVLIYSPLLPETQGFITPIHFESWWGTILFALAILLALFFELDTITIWVAKRTLHELWAITPMIAKVLPTLTLAVLFAFVNGDIWRVAEALAPSRTFEAMGVLFLLALIVAITTSIERTKRLLGATENDYLEEFPLTEYQATAQTAGSPWDALSRSLPASKLTQRRRLLNNSEWANLVALPVLSLMIQALLFALVVFCFFIWFGQIVIPTETITSWLTHPPADFTISGLTLPISAVLVKVSLILSAFASLNFVASTAGDDRYAQDFLAPMLTYLRETVIVRNIYLAAHRA